MRDPVTEARLQREGVPYTYREAVELAAIDVMAGLRNQSRLEAPLDKPTVERYALALIDGAKFPPVLLAPREGKGFLPVDGNHRIAAANEAELPSVDAYVLDVKDQLTLTRLIRTWNIGNGRQPSQADILEHALYLIATTPYTIRDVAKMVGMPENTLQGKAQARKGRDRLFGLGIPAEAFKDAHLQELSRLKDDTVLTEAARLVLRSGMTAERLAELVRTINAQSSEAERLALVKAATGRVKERVAASGAGRFTGPTRRSQVTKLLRSLNTTAKLLGRNPNAVQFGIIGQDDVTAIQGAYAEVANRVRRLLDTVPAGV